MTSLFPTDASQLVAQGLIVVVIILALAYYKLRSRKKQKDLNKQIDELYSS